MQTFLPFPSLLASAVTLDDRRLGKQRVEAFQILRALVFPTYGWKHHPAVAMWRGFTPALVGYGLTICREWERRGYADAVAGALLEFTGGAVSDLGALRIEGRRRPGSAPRRCMHRIGRLLRKDPDYYGEMFPATLAVSAELPYDWPPPLFPRWPVRRTGRLAAAEALAAARLDHQPEADAVVAAAVARLREGNEVGVATAPLALALATVLQLDPPALWLTHQPDVHLDAPPPYPPPAPRERPRGKLSPSIARPPSPADTAAMRQEAAADVGVVVHPQERPRRPRRRRAARRSTAQRGRCPGRSRRVRVASGLAPGQPRSSASIASANRRVSRRFNSPPATAPAKNGR